MFILTNTLDISDKIHRPQDKEIWSNVMHKGVTQTSELNLEAIFTDVTWSRGRNYIFINSHS